MFASGNLISDRDIVLAAVRQSGWSLQHASAGLKNNQDVVLSAVRNHSVALYYASHELRQDESFYWIVWQLILNYIHIHLDPCIME